MSRTLHYGVTNNFKPDGKQAFSIFQLVHDYKVRYEWTAETVDLSEFRIYPNYDLIHKADWNEADSALYQRVKKIVEDGIDYYDAISLLEKEQIIKIRKKDGLKGFTKVSSNELNAHTVIQFVIAVSKLIPETLLYLIDEGYALYCDLFIQNGLAKPHLDNIRKYISNNIGQEDHETDVRLEYYKRLVRSNPEFGNYEQYVRPLLDEAYLIERKQFRTTVLGSQNIDDLNQIMNNMLFSEKEQSSKYYRDINTYPV